MFTSLKVHPNFSIIETALVYVLSVVPKPGIVTAIIPFLSRFNLSKALAVTNNANVESRPPEIPTTAFLQLVCSNLFLSPIV